jgi:S-formylglutathione hydrolase FrmB
MAFIDCHFYSEILGLQSDMYVLLPQRMAGRKFRTDRKGKYPTLLLLHGMSDDHTIWLRRTSIERYADDKGMAVIMPAANRSYYQDMAYWLRYWTYIVDEVPRVARSFFPLSAERRLNFVAGLSMGGYGAFRVALSRPGSYAAAASLSGAVDMEARLRPGAGGVSRPPNEVKGVLGPAHSIKGTESDLFLLSRRVARRKERMPRLYQYCGRNDFLYQDNLRFRDCAWKLNMDLTYTEDDGNHSWEHWDRQIRLALDWMLGGGT